MNDDSVKELSKSLGEPSWLCDSRLSSLKEFNNSPSLKWKYGIRMVTDLSDLEFVASINVSFPKVTAPVGVEVVHFSDFSDLNNYFMKLAKISDKVSFFHASFFSSGFVIRIPDGFSSKEPIMIDLGNNSDYVGSHIIILAGSGSSVKVVENNVSSSKIITSIFEVFVENNASLEFCSLQNASNKSYVFSQKVASVKENGSIVWNDASFGSLFTKNTISSILSSPNASSESLVSCLLKGAQHSDLLVSVDHLAPFTKSVLSSKIVLDDESRVMARGRICMNKLAKNAVGSQRSDVLLLSDNAHADAVPILEIENNDVSCKHAATISQIDDEKLFYIMSRGLSSSEAKRKIIEGFIIPTLNKIPIKMTEWSNLE